MRPSVDTDKEPSLARQQNLRVFGDIKPRFSAMYGEVLHYEAYYLGLVAAWQSCGKKLHLLIMVLSGFGANKRLSADAAAGGPCAAQRQGCGRRPASQR